MRHVCAKPGAAPTFTAGRPARSPGLFHVGGEAQAQSCDTVLSSSARSWLQEKFRRKPFVRCERSSSQTPYSESRAGGAPPLSASIGAAACIHFRFTIQDAAPRPSQRSSDAHLRRNAVTPPTTNGGRKSPAFTAPQRGLRERHTNAAAPLAHESVLETAGFRSEAPFRSYLWQSLLQLFGHWT